MVSVDDPDTNKKFAEEHQADFPMLSDPGRIAATAYGVLPPPNPAQGDAPFRKELGAALSAAGEDLAAKLSELAEKGLVKKK